jgi:hypothetical protein
MVRFMGGVTSGMSGLRWSRVARWAVGVTSVALVVSIAEPVSAAPVPATVKVAAVAQAAVAAGSDTQRPDVVSAVIQAKAIKAAVQVLGATTESSTTWALPDGTFRVDSNPGPAAGAAGGWVVEGYGFGVGGG